MKSWRRERKNSRRRRIKNGARLRRIDAASPYSRARSRRLRIRFSLREFERLLRTPEMKIAVLVLFLAAMGIGAFFSSTILSSVDRGWSDLPTRLESIAVLGNWHLAPNEIAAATGLAKESPLDAIDVDEIEARLVEHPWIRGATAMKLPTGQLLIRVEERTAEAVLRGPIDPGAEDQQRLVDADGTPFDVAAPADLALLPRLRTARAFETGVASPRLAEAIAIAARLPMLKPKPGSASEEPYMRLPRAGTDDGWVIELADPRRRVILGEDDLDRRIDHLARLLRAAPLSEMAANEIDLRFAGRAVLREGSAID